MQSAGKPVESIPVRPTIWRGSRSGPDPEERSRAVFSRRRPALAEYPDVLARAGQARCNADSRVPGRPFQDPRRIALRIDGDIKRRQPRR